MEELVDHHMHKRDREGQAEATVEHSLVLLMASPVDPLEEADDETGAGDEYRDGEVDDGHVDLAVHAVVDRRKRTPRDQ